MDEILLVMMLAAAAFRTRQGRKRIRARQHRAVSAPFKLENFNEEACLHLFRFGPSQILEISSMIFYSNSIALENRARISDVEALCILLNRLSYPSRLETMESTFGRSFTTLSRIINTTIDLILDSCGHVLSISSAFVNEENIRRWMNAIREKGAPLEHCFGFVDGTVRPICRPSRNQKQSYNGHKRVHSLKFQSVSAPNGIIVDLTGPWEGRRHDCGMLRESGLLERLEKIRVSFGTAYIYGDPAYPVSSVLQTPFKGSHISEYQKEWNMRMSSVRVSVEWCFGKVLTLFPFVDFKKNLKVYLQPVAKFYKIAVLFTNVHTCLYGSVTTSFFDVEAPELKCYLLRAESSS
jgi:nuclease HARBI1